MLTLEPITLENYDIARALSLRPGQERFVAPVVRSIADAYVYEEAVPRLARADGAAVGFVLLFPYDDSGVSVVTVVRLLIDQAHQGKGLGRQTLTAALDLALTFEPRPQRFKISALPENEVALGLYRSEGFVDAGMEDDEIVLWREVAPSGA